LGIVAPTIQYFRGEIMFVRPGLFVLLLTVMPALVLAGGSDPEKPQYGEIGGAAEPQQSSDEPQQKAPVLTRMFDIMVGAGFGYGLPLGDFYYGLNPGLLYFGDVRIAVSRKVYFKLGFKNMNVYKETRDINDYNGDYAGTVDLAVDIRQYLFSVGFLPPPNERNNLRLYIEAGGGLGDRVSTASDGTVSQSRQKGYPMIVGQFGLLLPFKKSRVGMDLGVSVLWKFYTEKSYESMGALIAVHLGLMVRFGGG